MKRIYNCLWSISLALVLGVLAGCSADTYDSVDPNNLPDANDIDVTVDVDQETNTYTLTLNNKGYYPVWTVYTGKNPQRSTLNGFSKVIPNAGTYLVEVRMGNRNGISTGSKTYEIVIEKDLAGDVFKGFVYDSEFNLWKDCTIHDTSTWFADNDWNNTAVTQPVIDFANEGFSFVIPAGTGSQQWQGQVHVPTDISTNSSTRYDFSVFIESSENHPGVTVKLQDNDNDGVFYCEAKVPVEAGSGKCYYFSDVEGLDIANIQLCLDFAGGVAGSEVRVSNIVIKDHANDDGTELPPSVEFEDARNLFTGFSVEKVTTWFANNDWNDGAVVQPTINTTSDGYSFVIPEGMGSQQWQGQVHMWTNVPTTSSKRYDFKVELLCTEDHPGVTIKLQKGDSLGEDSDADDNVYYCLQSVPLKANITQTYYFEDIAGLDIQKLQVCCDYAGGVAGAEVTLSGLHLQEHL